jgi:transglutaminase superfamily protein
MSKGGIGMSLYLQALWQLLRFEYYIQRGNFGLLHRKVREYSVHVAESRDEDTDRICRAIDIVCILYPKHILCLQRSAASACLLRQHGLPAKMMLGVQQLPFRAHAWVEVDGHVVNDKPYTLEIYTVLDRC